MKIRLTEERTGPRYDGRRWPGVGEPFDVPDDEGKAIVAAGWAEEIKPPKPQRTAKPAKE